jgi:hypothetical protein
VNFVNLGRYLAHLVASRGSNFMRTTIQVAISPRQMWSFIGLCLIILALPTASNDVPDNPTQLVLHGNTAGTLMDRDCLHKDLDS